MDITTIALKQIEVAQRAKKSKIEEIKKSEDLYYNRTTKTLKGRFNVPLPIMSGFVDTLKSKIDDKPAINFLHTKDSELKKAKKISKAWEIDSGTSRGNWGSVDRQAKGLAIFSGRAIYKIFAESEPKYKTNLEVVDYYNFLCEPKGGSDLERHLFCGQTSIFKTKEELIEGVKNGIYDKKGVAMLLNAESDTKEDEEDETSKNNRTNNTDINNNGYVGEMIYNLTEWYMNFGGKRHYLLFHKPTKIIVRKEALRDVFSSNLYPFATWATNPDPYNFWSKAPVDDIRPIAEASKILFNQALDNIQKQNWGQRAYDSSIFPNPEELEWRPDGLVMATAVKNGRNIKDGIYEFQTASNETVVLNLMSYLDNYMGQKSGITPASQGASDKNAKVGIYYGDMKQVQDRLGFYNKEYTDCWVRLGERYRWGLIDHMTEPIAVDLLGERGIEWDELVRQDLKGDYGISITSGAEAEEDELTKQRKENALKEISTDQTIASIINPKWKLENYLRNAGYSEEEIRRASDKTEGSDDSISEAAQENEDILKGKQVKPNRSATLAHIQRHIDYAADNSESLKDEQYQALLEHIDAEKPIAEQNMKRKASNMQVGTQEAEQAQTEEINPSMMSRSQNISNSLIPQNV